jgi:hypothetical protein
VEDKRELSATVHDRVAASLLHSTDPALKVSDGLPEDATNQHVAREAFPAFGIAGGDAHVI